MEIEQSAPVAKKLWNIIRVMFMMLRKGIAKSKIVKDFNLLLKRGKLTACKAIANTFMLHHHYTAAFTCQRSNLSFISPRHYEFSCSNSPAFPFHNHYHHYHNHHRQKRPFSRFSKSCQYEEVFTLDAVQKMSEMLNSDDKVEASPLVTLPGFGKSPIGRQLRITDSPFPLKDEGDHGHVDMAAEEFIKKFYKDLNSQQKMAAIESPYHKLWDR